MTTQWLVRYSEIFLKSDPVRRHWEQVLMNNIRQVMPDLKIKSERGRIWLTGDVDPEKLRHVFGIVSFSEVEHVPHGVPLETALIEYGRAHGLPAAKTFALKIKRVGKHSFSSNDKAIELGDVVRKAFPHLKVNLATPDVEIHVEIRQDECYLYDTVIKGAGGLPLGVEGTLVALVSGGIDSPVAAWMMMKRGCRIVPVFVALDTFLDETVLARAERVVEILRKYQPDIQLRVIHDSYLAAAKKELIPEPPGEVYLPLLQAPDVPDCRECGSGGRGKGDRERRVARAGGKPDPRQPCCPLRCSHNPGLPPAHRV